MDYVSIGKIVAIHGLKGQVILQHVLGKKTSLKGLQTIFTQDKLSTYFPWFVKEAKSKSITETYITIEDVTTPEAASKLLQKTIWLPKQEASKYTAPTSTLSLIGSTIYNQQERLGEIIEVIEQSHQMLCIIMIEGKEVYIPLHQDSLLRIDVGKKAVYVDLPEGLLELYL